MLPIPSFLLVLVAAAPPQGAPAPSGSDGGGCCRPPQQAVDPSKLPHDRKSVLLHDLATQLIEGDAPFFGTRSRDEVMRKAAALPSNASPRVAFETFRAAGDYHLADGELDEAVAAYQHCASIAEKYGQTRWQAYALRQVALCWMRIGERSNCIARHNQDSCILPLQGGAIHVDRRGSEQAVAVLEKILRDLAPHDLGSIWLLNVAHMTLGDWPAAVPEGCRIDPQAFASQYELPRMVDVAARKKLNVIGNAGGSCMDDFDGDGRLDVVVSSFDPFQPLRMLRQQPDGTFVDVADEVGLSGQIGGLNFIHFDANNDGRLDLLVQRGAWEMQYGRIPNSLLIQRPDGSFVDRTREAGIEIRAPSQVAAAADIDNDGDLDLFLGYESLPSAPGNDFPCRLFENRGDGTFADVTARAGVADGGYCKGAVFGDYDGDGFPDLYVSNMLGQNHLYHNDRDGKFTDVARQLGVDHPYGSFGCWFFDYDNDGWLDLFCTSYETSGEGRDRASILCDYYLHGIVESDTQRLYRNDGHGGFRDVTKEVGLDRVAFAMGCNFGDIDEDGFPDIYLGTGDPEFRSLWPNVLYRNDAGRRFQDVTAATGTGHLQKGHGVSFGDIDGDGDVDLFEELGGALKDDVFSSALFENPGHGRHFLTVRVVGHRTNRFGVGVVLRATIEEPAGRRDVVAFVGANSSFGGNSLQEEMGLGAATRLVELEVTWPVTGIVDRFGDVPLDSVIVVEEGAGWHLAPPPAAASARASQQSAASR